MSTPNIFSLVKDHIATNLLGSIVLFALFIIFILIILVLAAKISVRIGLVLIFPAILALTGIGVNQGLLGINYRWIGVLIVVAVSLVFAFIWHKISE